MAAQGGARGEALRWLVEDKSMMCVFEKTFSVINVEAYSGCSSLRSVGHH